MVEVAATVDLKDLGKYHKEKVKLNLPNGKTVSQFHLQSSLFVEPHYILFFFKRKKKSCTFQRRGSFILT